MAEFGGKIFNAEAFERYTKTLPRLKRNELLKSGAIYVDQKKVNTMRNQTTTHIITEPIFGLIGGEPVNYDGNTDIKTHETPTAQQTMVVFGRANGWKETDFAEDIASTNFMNNVGSQINDYKDERDQEEIIAILNGIFSMTGAKNKVFPEQHTYKVDKPIDAITLNMAGQKALGQNKGDIALIIMHSRVATTLENLQLLEYVTYNDEHGIQRPMGIARYAGKTVLIDDSMPFDEKTGEYTSYILGRKVLGYTPIAPKTPYEVVREAKAKGGYTELIHRWRRLVQPKGISFTQKSVASLSPTTAELAKGENWELVVDTNGDVIDHQSIAIGRIITVEDKIEGGEEIGG